MCGRLRYSGGIAYDECQRGQVLWYMYEMRTSRGPKVIVCMCEKQNCH